jgi:hypothetical protein
MEEALPVKPAEIKCGKLTRSIFEKRRTLSMKTVSDGSMFTGYS